MDVVSRQKKTIRQADGAASREAEFQSRDNKNRVSTNLEELEKSIV